MLMKALAGCIFNSVNAIISINSGKEIMKYLSLILLCSVAFAGGDLPGIIGDLGAPVEVTGSLVGQASIVPIWLTGDVEEVVEPLPLFSRLQSMQQLTHSIAGS
jgi:hypothetical protein